MRLIPILILIALAACSDADSAESPTRASAPVEVRLVADDPAVQQRLTPPDLLAYYPEMVGDREQTFDPSFLYDSGSEAGWTKASVDYEAPRGADASGQVLIQVFDYVDDPEELARERRKVDDGYGISSNSGPGEIRDIREVAGGAGRAFVSSGSNWRALHVLLADRFLVSFSAQQQDMTEDDIWALYDASGLGRLAGAPVRGGAGVPPVPAWAAAGVAEWERSASEPADEAAAPSATAARPLPPCDDLLPLAEVERACGVSGARVSTSPFSEEGATSCNRKYALPRNLSGFVFIVSRFDNIRTARAGQRVASEAETATERRDVAGLGDAATRYVLDLSGQRTTTGVLAFAVGTDVVEMKTTTMPDERGAEVCTLDQLETLARTVAGRLTR